MSFAAECHDMCYVVALCYFCLLPEYSVNVSYVTATGLWRSIV